MNLLLTWYWRYSTAVFIFFQVLASQGEVGAIELDLLLRFPIQPNVVSPIDFITNNNWGAIRSLSQVDEFR